MEHYRNNKPNESADQGTNSASDEQAVRNEQLQQTDVNPSDSAINGEAGANKNKKKSSRAGNEITEWIKALAIAGLLVFVIRFFLFGPFIVDGESMEPSFWDRERIIVNKILYDIRQPERGEVIVFHVPTQGRDYIKRVIGVPGDEVKVEGDTVYINGAPIEEGYLKDAYEKAHLQGVLYNTNDSDLSNFPNSRFQDVTVPEGMLFVLGDNRANSEDSRRIGFISQDEVVGRADLIFWPVKDFSFISH